MGVLGHWRRSALGAGGVALLLPVGLAIGVALTTAFGGSSGLRSLAQVFSGPSMPAAGGRSAAPGLESARDVPAIPLPPRRAAAVPSAPVGAGTAPSSSGTGTPGGTTHTPSTPQGTGGGTPKPSTPQPPSGGGGQSSGGGGSAPPTPPAPQPSTLHNSGQQVADTAKGLPGPAGQVAGSAAQTVVDLIP